MFKMKINRLDGYEFVGLTGNRRRFLAAKFWPANHQPQCWQSRTCICCHNWGSTYKGCRRTSQEPGTPRCTAQPPPPMSRTLLKHVMMFFCQKLTVGILHFEKPPQGSPLAGLSFHLLLQEHLAQSLASTSTTWREWKGTTNLAWRSNRPAWFRFS